MSDLISRQKAYEVLTDYYHHNTDVQHEALREALERVPSAEPERIIKIAQRSGKTLESAIYYLNSVGWLQEHDRILTESVKPERWIPVTEALPEEMTMVLVTCADGTMRTSVLTDITYWHGIGRGGVIAWMPLPEPWRGDDEDA